MVLLHGELMLGLVLVLCIVGLKPAGVETEVFVVVVTLSIDLVTLPVHRRGCREWHGSVHLDRAALAGPVHCSKRLCRQASHGTASRVWQLLLCSHARCRGPALPHDRPPLVDEAVKVPIAVVHALLAELSRRLSTERDADGREVGRARGPSVRLQVVDLAASILELHLDLPAGIVGASIAAQNLNLPVLLARLVRLVGPMVVGVGDVVEQLLRVGVEQRRGGQRRVGGRRGVREAAGGVDLVDLALSLVGKQALSHAAVEGVELLLGGRRDGPRLGGGEGRGREESRGRGQDVQTQRREVERVRVKVEEAASGGFVAAGVSQYMLTSLAS